jgi:beta-lactamase class A
VGPAQVPPSPRAVEFQAPKPVLLGNTRDGSSVQVSAGYWTPTPARVAFQWFADGKPIAGATGRNLAVGANLVGRRLSATVTGTRDGYTTKTVSSDQTKPVAKGVSDEALLLSKIKARLDEHGWKYTVAVRELTGPKRTTSVYGTSKREPASTSKLFIAYAVLDNADNGITSLSRKLPSGYSVRDCLRAMIEVSDNYCARDLMALLGRTKLNTKLAREGYGATQFLSGTNSSGWTKTTSSNDLALLVQRLQQGTLLSGSNTSYLLGLMQTQIWKTRIGSGVPEGINTASKVGELWLSSGMIQADAGVVYGAKSTFVISVLGANGATKKAISALTKTVYLHLNELPSSTPTKVYPTAQMKTTRSTTVRSSPGGGVVATLPAGTNVEIVNSQRGMYWGMGGGKRGWISFSDLRSRWVG